MIEKYLIEHCSPTLASIKTANLFSVSLEKEKDAETQLQRWGSLLYEKGIELVVIRLCEKRALVYVYRRSMLVEDLGRQGVFDFLNKYGYNSLDPDEALCRLAYRIRCSQEFPHEIGVFLGYPLNDVKCFIRYGGRNCKCSGCWQAYSNEEEALRIFSKYSKCRAVYKKKWQSGRSVMELTVAA